MSAIDPDRRITAVQRSKSNALMSELGQKRPRQPRPHVHSFPVLSPKMG